MNVESRQTTEPEPGSEDPAAARADVGRRALDRRLLYLAAACAAMFAVLAVAVAQRWTPLIRADGAVATRTHTWGVSHHPLVSAAKLVSDVARPTTFELVSAAIVVALLVCRRWLTAVQLATATVAAMSSVSGFKALVRRRRPSLDLRLAHAHGWSFPSSHALTAATAISAYVLILGGLGIGSTVRRVLAVVGAVVAVTIAASRVVLGVHYLSDVLAGLLLGFALTFTSFELWRWSAKPTVVDAAGAATPPAAVSSGD